MELAFRDSITSMSGIATVQIDMTAGVRGRLLRDATWVALGQLLTGLAAIVGLRIVTEYLSPEQFGHMTLLIAIASLALSLTSTPFLQAVFRFYPDYAQRAEVGVVQRAASRLIVRTVALGIVVVGVGHMAFGHLVGQAWWLGWVVGFLVAIDALRSFYLAFLNAARRQKPAAFIQAADGWLRPLGLVLVVAALGPGEEAGLLGYALGAGVVALYVSMQLLRGWPKDVLPQAAEASAHSVAQLGGVMKTYALPLVPLAIFGWLSGAGDRYVIAGMLSVSDVGLYAAAYGLASRPFLMASAVLEQTYRPVLHNAISAGQRDAIRQMKRRILAITAVVAVVGALCFWGLSDFAASLLLAAEYRSSAGLMPWIALGYAFLMMAGAYSRLCYAFDATRSVLITSTISSSIGLGVLAISAARFGLAGVTVAVPVRFLVELMFAWWFARKSERQYFLKVGMA